MASAAGTNDLLKSLQNTVNCSVCRDIFTDPVTLHCGHNFCRSCITQRWEGLKRNFPCPQCRKRFRKGTMRPNSQLEEIAKQIPAPAVKGSEGEKLCETHKKAKQVQALAVKGSEGEKMCEKHKKPWMLFCEDDKELTCMDCRMSYKHRGHNVLSIEDAAKVYKHEIHLKLNYFKKEKERMLTLKTNEGKKIDTLLTQTATERKEITSYFGQQHQILKYEEQCLMEKLDEIDQTILKRKYKWFAGFMEIMLPIENAISNIEETCQQPEIEFLKNVESTRSGYSWYLDGMTPDVRDEVKDLNPILSDIEKDFCCFSKKFKVLKESLMLNKVGPSTNRGLSGPAAAATAAPPAAQPRRWRVQQRDQLLRHHDQAVKRVGAAITRRVEVDLQWHSEAWGAFQAQCIRMADAISMLTAHIGHAIHYAPMHPPSLP